MMKRIPGSAKDLRPQVKRSLVVWQGLTLKRKRQDSFQSQGKNWRSNKNPNAQNRNWSSARPPLPVAPWLPPTATVPSRFLHQHLKWTPWFLLIFFYSPNQTIEAYGSSSKYHKSSQINHQNPSAPCAQLLLQQPIWLQSLARRSPSCGNDLLGKDLAFRSANCEFSMPRVVVFAFQNVFFQHKHMCFYKIVMLEPQFLSSGTDNNIMSAAFQDVHLDFLQK